MPTPNPGESRDDFVSRCIPIVIEEGTPEDQAQAICFSMYEDGKQAGSNPPQRKEIAFDNFQVKQSDVIVDGEELEVATFTGVANVMEHEDLGGDVIHQGAFKKTLEEKEGAVPFVTDHTYKIKNSIGVAFLEEQGNLLKAEVDILVSNNPEGKEFLSKAKFFKARGKPLGLSIGYDIPKGKSEMKDGKRHIYEIKLFEVSGVLFPMNELSRAVGFKGYDFDSLEDQKQLIEQILETKGMHLGEFLNRAVNENAQSQEDVQRIIGDLSDRAGMSRDRIAEVLNGQMIRPSDNVLEIFAEVLDVPFEQLITLADSDIGKNMETDENRNESGQSEGKETLKETYKEIKSLLNDEPSDDTHNPEADLSEALTQIKQINQT